MTNKNLFNLHYIGVHESLKTTIKPGCSTINGFVDRLAGYTKTGANMEIHSIIICQPGLETRMENFETRCIEYFQSYRTINNKGPSEYLSMELSPNGLPLLTIESVVEWYHNEIANMQGFYALKKDLFPISLLLGMDVGKLMKKIERNPDTYLQQNA
tara:strand:+ start:1216 stop:1686 length:471 start_codon:yes stop_codon:yes gene_type:complete